MRNDVPAIVRPKHPRGRESRIACEDEDTPLGVAVYLTAEELSEFGMDPEVADAVEVTVDDGEVSLIPISWGQR
jgi:hypothetical protein